MNEQQELARLEALPYKLNHNIREILDGFKWAIWKKNTTAVMITDGRSGMGKTTFTMQMGKYCDPDFGLHKIHWDPDTFLNGGEGKVGLANCKKGDFILFDEAMLISSRSALTQINKMIVQAMSMIRSKNVIVVFCVNSIFDLDRNLALSRADIMWHVYGDSLTDRGKVMAFFKGADDRDRLKELYLNGKKFYDYSKPKSNFNTTFPSYFVVDEVEYEKQKQAGVNAFLQGKSKEVKNQTLMSRNRLIKWIKENHPDLSNQDLCDISGLSPRMIRYVMEELREDQSSVEQSRFVMPR